MRRLGFVVAACLIVVTQASANEPCTAMAYRNQNQVDMKIHIHGVKGVAVAERGGPIPGVCVGVFAEPDHRLIATVKTGANGKFRLPSIGRGTYRLVAEYQGFGVATSTIIVGKQGEKSVVVRMRPAGIDSTSHVEKPSPDDNSHWWRLNAFLVFAQSQAGDLIRSHFCAVPSIAEELLRKHELSLPGGPRRDAEGI